MRNLKTCIFIYSLFLFLFTYKANLLQAQVSDAHLDIGYDFNYFTNLKGHDFDTSTDGYAIRFGMNWILADKENLYIGLEMGYSQRNLEQNLGDVDYNLKFRSFDIAPVFGLSIIKNLRLEMVSGFSFYLTNLYSDGNSEKLGDGFRIFDIYGALGLAYQVHKNLSAGYRMRYGFLPALSYEAIGKYGEMEKETKIINPFTIEIFIRFNFYSRK